MNILEDHTAEAIAAKNDAVRRFLEEAGQHLEGEAKEELENDPRRVDTGLLRNSVTFALDGEGAEIDSYQSEGVDKRGNPIEVKKGVYAGKTPKEPAGHDTLYVGTNVEYGKYVHEGTSGMTPNRFLKNAFERNAGQLKDKLKEALEGK